MQADAPPERLVAGRVEGTDLRLVVHQAAGLLSAQLEQTGKGREAAKPTETNLPSSTTSS